MDSLVMGLFSYLMDMDGGGDYPDDWEQIASEILQRDDYTCQRCGHLSGPYAEEDGRILDAHHIVPKADGGGDGKDNLITLCRPCHAVQHPNNESFDQVRSDAPLFPGIDADSAVAFVNSKIERESTGAYLDRMGNRCARCWDHDIHTDLVLYLTSSDFDADVDYRGEKYYPVCSSCLAVVVMHDPNYTAQEGVQHMIRYDDVYTTVDIESFADEYAQQSYSYHPHPTLRVPGGDTAGVVGMILTNNIVLWVIALCGWIIGHVIGRP